MRQTVKNRMIKNVQMMAVGMMATASIMGTAAAMGVKMDNIPFNVLANPFQAVMTQGVAAIELGSSGSCGDNATYELSMNGTLTISGTGALDKNVFYDVKGNKNIKKVIINEGITEIGEKTFYGCSEVTQIELPETLSKIGKQAISCQKLTEIHIPENVTSIEQSAFFKCKSLKQIVIPNSITQISDSAFSGCEELTSITLPSNLSQIGTNAFYDCKSLVYLDIPESVKQIGEQAFQGCEQLIQINIPEGVNQIGQFTFNYCEQLKSIYIPDSVSQIGLYAFQGCNNLVLFQGMHGVNSISKFAFIATDPYNQNNLLETTLETDNEYILDYNWRGDNRSIKITETPECGPDATYEEDDGKLTITGSGSIDDEAFKDKDTVTEVVIEEGITEIGDQSFENMDNLEKVTIPDSVTNIGDQAFAENPKLEIVQGGDNADIADNAFDCTEPETTIKTDNENIYNNIKDNTDRDVQLQNSVPISPVEENWLYSSDDEAFITDKVQVGSVKDDFESLLDEFATVVGLDEKQGAKQNYETADASDEDTLVYCTKASDWIITIPKDLVMSGDDESRAEYVVGIYGNVDPAKRVTVTPAPSFEMTNTGNAEVKYNAQVSQPVTGINGMDIIESPEADVDDASQMSGTITANLKRAGSYRGTMTFTVDYVDHT